MTCTFLPDLRPYVGRPSGRTVVHITKPTPKEAPSRVSWQIQKRHLAMEASKDEASIWWGNSPSKQGIHQIHHSKSGFCRTKPGVLCVIFQLHHPNRENHCVFFVLESKRPRKSVAQGSLFHLSCGVAGSSPRYTMSLPVAWFRITPHFFLGGVTHSQGHRISVEHAMFIENRVLRYSLMFWTHHIIQKHIGETLKVWCFQIVLIIIFACENHEILPLELLAQKRLPVHRFHLLGWRISAESHGQGGPKKPLIEWAVSHGI